MPRLSVSLADRAYKRLEEMIVTLDLPPGSMVSEREILKKIRIGRTPTREALQRLAAGRLVSVIPRRGVRVCDLDLIDQMGLLEARRVLDRLIAARAARRATREQREALKGGPGAMEMAAARHDLRAFLRAQCMLQDVLDQAAHNPSASQAVSSLHTRSQRLWFAQQHNGDLQRAARLHGSLVRSVVGGDADGACQASDSLIEYLEDITRSLLEG